MAGKDIFFGEDARNELLAGIEQLAKIVGTTHGPQGRSVLIEKSFGSPTVSSDGATIAKEIELKEKRPNVGVTLIREVAKKQSDEAGDGTTTSICLAHNIFRESLKNVAAGTDAMAIKRGIDHGVRVAVEAMKKMSRPVKGKDDLTRVATLAANGDSEVGALIADAMSKTGVEGAITVEEGKGIDTALNFVEGMQFDKGYLSPYFVTNFDTMECVLEDAYVLIHDKKITAAKDLVGILEKCVAAKKPLLVVAEEIEGEALAVLVINKIRGILSCCGVKAPGFGDRRKAMLEDMAVLTGGRAVTEDAGMKLEKIGLNVLGRAKKVTVDKENTTLAQGAGKKSDIQARIDQVKRMIETTTSDYDREKLEERLAKLTGGVAVIEVGANTEAVMKEKKERVDDAVAATRAAAEEGVVPGGGVVYLRAAQALTKEKLQDQAEQVGLEVLKRALSAPVRQIARNAGENGEVVVEKVADLESNMGFDAVSREYVDMAKAGIIDPLKVTRLALENAASIGSMLVSAQAVVCKLPEKPKPEMPESEEDMY
jgi:chaperonin GroEL